MYSQATLFCDGWVTVCSDMSLLWMSCSKKGLYSDNLCLWVIFVIEGEVACTWEAVPWHSGLSLVMRDAEFGQWSWLFASVKSSDCAQHFWRDEVSGLNVLVVHMSPRRVKVALSPWEEWGDRHSSSHGSCWHVEVGKMGFLIHAGISLKELLLVSLLFHLDL